ncbi:MAG TPA: hypothetical protein PLV92_00520, partial [Pirellulaceae bacterium]|nr:hypothetical protein [Pirellulaceae bacterium]
VLVDLQKKGASVQLIDCARVTQPNLAIVDVKPADDTRAAGVPLFVDVAVKNFGAAPVKRVLVKVRSLYFAPELAEDGPSPRGEGDSEELPTIVLDELKPGETAVRRVQVYFAKPGQHVVEATLPDDPVVADNRRWCVIDFPEGDNVLVIDGSPATKPGQNLKPPSYFLEAAFQPSQRVRTGILPTIQPTAFLRDIAPTELAKYQTVYLLDVDRLDDQAVTKLEAFVRAGGGLAVFVGDQSNLTFMNTKLYREGGGLSPVELDRIDLLPPPLNEDAADIEVDDHPIFAMFQGERNPFIRMVTIEKYLKAKDSFAPPPGSTVRVAARLRNRQPLAIEHKFGEGHVVVFLTAIDKNWNNWAQGPSFIGVLLKLQSFLTASRREIDPRVVGTPLEVDFDKDRFRSTVQFLAPAAKQGSRTLVEDQAQPVPNASGKLRAKIGVGVGGVAASATQRAGIYEAWQQKATEGYEVSRFALNVDPTEGDLAHMESATLTAKLAPVRVKYSPAEQFELDAGDQSGMNRSLFVMALLILLLLIEQFVAYQFSYHPAKVAAGVPVASRGLAGRAMARVAAGGEPVATSRGGN